MTETIRSYRDLVPAVEAVYAHSCVGCCWHCVLDDGNYRDCFVRECSADAAEKACSPCMALAAFMARPGATITKLRKASFRARHPLDPEGMVRA